MNSMRNFAVCSLVALGGCFFSYDYEDKKPVGTSSSSSGTSSSGAALPTYECDYGTCLRNEWAQRYGVAKDNQTAAGVAFDSKGNIVLAGNYDQFSFNVGGIDIDPQTSPEGNGFLAWIKPDGLSAQWAGGLAQAANDAASIQALAIDTKDYAIAVGFGAKTGEITHGRVQKRSSSSDAIKTLSIGELLKEAKAYAVATSGTNVYVAGHWAGQSMQCGNIIAGSTEGMFIAKYTDDNMGGLACAWMRHIAKVDAMPTAVVARLNKVWVTGTFTTEATAPAFEWALSGGQMGTFLMAIEGDTGNVLKGTTLSLGANSTIRARAITAGPTGSNTGTHVFLAGEYSGNEPGLLPVSTGPAAFVADFVDADIVAIKNQWIKGITATDRINATGIAYHGTQLYLAGTLAGTVDLGAKQLQFANTHMHPYLAVFKDVTVSIASLAGFDVFPSNGEIAADRAMLIDASTSGVVLGGSWAHDVDFSTTSEATGFVKALEGPEPLTLDAVVAKFAYP